MFYIDDCEWWCYWNRLVCIPNVGNLVIFKKGLDNAVVINYISYDLFNPNRVDRNALFGCGYLSYH